MESSCYDLSGLNVIAGRHKEQPILANSQPQLFLVTLKSLNAVGTQSHKAIQR
jgi:hypothetical protein